MQLVREQEDIISFSAINGLFIGLVVNGVDFPKAVYKFARNPLMHDAELDPRISFSNDSGISIGDEWSLPQSYLNGLAMGVISAKENADEEESLNWRVLFAGQNLHLQKLWGAEDFLRALIENYYGRSSR